MMPPSLSAALCVVFAKHQPDSFMPRDRKTPLDLPGKEKKRWGGNVQLVLDWFEGKEAFLARSEMWTGSGKR